MVKSTCIVCFENCNLVWCNFPVPVGIEKHDAPLPYFSATCLVQSPGSSSAIYIYTLGSESCVKTMKELLVPDEQHLTEQRKEERSKMRVLALTLQKHFNKLCPVTSTSKKL